MDSDDSGFISAANLKELLGDEFPQSEIDDIIKEADITMDGKISYSEFLALWEDKNETKYASDIHEIRKLRDAYETDGSSILSENTSEEDVAEVASRALFLDGKRTSERKATEEVEIPAATKPRHVGFHEIIHTIPTFDDKNGENAITKKESETTSKLKKELSV